MVLINPRGLAILALGGSRSSGSGPSTPQAPAKPDLTGLVRQFVNRNRFIGPILTDIVGSNGQSLNNTVGISCRLEKWTMIGSGYGPDLSDHERVCDFYGPYAHEDVNTADAHILCKMSQQWDTGYCSEACDWQLPRVRPTASYLAQAQLDEAALSVPVDSKPMPEKTEQRNLFCSPPDTDQTIDKLSDPEKKGDAVFEKLKFYAQHAASAYCNSPKRAGEAIKCTKNNNCPSLEENKVAVVHSFAGGELDINGYVALDPTRDEVVISFRGSHSIPNWYANFDMGFLPYKSVSGITAAPPGSEVHRGFARAWMEVRDNVSEALTRATNALPPSRDRSVRIVGHSLGGAIATLASAELGERNYTVSAVTYGAPRVGNIAFATWLTAQSNGAIYRVTHGGDPVPHLPLMALGYAHTSPEFWIDADSFEHDYRPSQITKCTGITNKQCNVGTFGLEVVSHFYYFRDDECRPLVPLKRQDSGHEIPLPEDTKQAIQQEQVAAKAIKPNYRIPEDGKHCMRVLGLGLSHDVGHRIRGRSVDGETEYNAHKKRQLDRVCRGEVKVRHGMEELSVASDYYILAPSRS